MATAFYHTVMLGFVAAWLTGCSGASQMPSDGPQTADAVLATALAKPLPNTVAGMARLDSYVKGEARKADLLVIVRRPAAVQMQALTPTSDLIAILSTDGQRFISFERGGAECHTGLACPQNLARLLPIALPPQQLAEALLGRPPLLDLPTKTLRWDEAKSAYRIDISGPGSSRRQEVYVLPRSFRFLGTVLYEGAARVGSIAYDGAVGTDGPPKTFRFRSKAQDLDVSVTLRDVEVNGAVGDDVFDVQCPQGARVVELPCP